MIKITKTELEALVNKGYKRKDLAEHFGLNMSAVGRLLKEASLRIKAYKGKSFVLVDDTEKEEVEEEIVETTEKGLRGEGETLTQGFDDFEDPREILNSIN